MTIINFAIAELNYGEKKLKLGPVKLNSFIYLARLAVYQALIVSLQFMPRLLICVIGSIELFCLFSGLYLVRKHNHLRDTKVVIHRVIQNTAIFFFLILNFIIAEKRAKFNYDVPSTVQLIAMWTIVFSICIEYLFLIMGLIVALVKKFLKKGKKLEQ